MHAAKQCVSVLAPVTMHCDTTCKANISTTSKLLEVVEVVFNIIRAHHSSGCHKGCGDHGIEVRSADWTKCKDQQGQQHLQHNTIIWQYDRSSQSQNLLCLVAA